MPGKQASLVNANADGVRLDVWLWAARFYKTRSLAKQAIEGGKVEVNDAAPKPARSVHIDDRIRITRGIERMQVRVSAISSARGPATQGQALYEETPESREAREAAREMHRLTGAELDHPPSRPGKHSRRLLREFKEGGR
ncbi:MAG: RNA-binding protein [Dokdonella sp.]|nr:RNA-binding protein [Dokdonella sp.]MCB1570427.1 RNA-binding protein [Xanthomonadales bacterium]MCB1574067.1 RNA-binding protein [Xanthomonadales bacterium]MCB1576363.1 RNA-binding protein [Xanthomonadales bacterium]